MSNWSRCSVNARREDRADHSLGEGNSGKDSLGYCALEMIDGPNKMLSPQARLYGAESHALETEGIDGARCDMEIGQQPHDAADVCSPASHAPYFTA